MANPRKAFRIDAGLIPVSDRSGRTNLGHALETTVALELLRRGAEIAYVRTAENLEVDFLARSTDGREQLIQVCADLDSPETREREVRLCWQPLMTIAAPSGTSLHWPLKPCEGCPPKSACILRPLGCWKRRTAASEAGQS